MRFFWAACILICLSLPLACTSEGPSSPPKKHTKTPTATSTQIPDTATPTPTLSATSTATETLTLAPTTSSTSTPSPTPSPSTTPTITPTFSPTVTPSLTASPTPTLTPSSTPTPTRTNTITPTPTKTATSALTLPCNPASTFGKTAVGGSAGAFVSSLMATKYVLSAPGTIYSLSAYLGGSSNGVKLALYSDSGNVPQNLLGECPPQVSVPGWNNEVLTSPLVLGAGTYWLVCQFQTGVSIPYDLNFSTSPGYQLPYAYGSFPSVFPVGTPNAFEFSFYGSFCAAPTPLVPYTPTLTLTPTLSPTPVVVNIPDANLLAAVRTAIPKPSGPIYASDVSPLTYLTAINVANLTGLQYFDHLTLLTLQGTFTDLSPLSGLDKLQALNLVNDTSLTNLSPLAALTGLEALNFNGDTSLANLSPLSGLTNLLTLALIGDAVSDVGALVTNSGLGVGDSVDLTTNPLSVNAVVNQIPILQGRGVTVTYNAYTPTPTITATPFAVTFPDANLLAKVRLAIAKPTGTIFSTDLAGFTTLSASNASIADLTGLQYCAALQTILLDHNSITSLTPLAGLQPYILSLQYNGISSLTPLAGMTTRLWSLSLDHNSITSLTPLSGLTNLQNLTLGYNTINDVTPLSGLSLLHTLYLNNNALTDLAALASNTGIATGDTVDVTSNPLGPTAVFTQVPTIQGRGATVYYNAYTPTRTQTPTSTSTLPVTSTPTATSTQFIVNFPDANLQARIRTVIGKPTGSIYNTDLLPLTSLDASSHFISLLTGLEACVNLVTLDLSGNAVTNLAPLAA